MRRLRVPALLGLLSLPLLGGAGDPPGGTPTPAAPGSEVVAQRGNVRLTAADVRDLLDRADPALRAQLAANPAAFNGFVRDRLLAQTLLAEARAKGWDQRPEVAARVRDAYDTVIVQTYLASLTQPDPSYPGEAEIAAAYEANKPRLMLPRQYRLAQIAVLVAPNAGKEADEEAHRKIQDIRQQLGKPHADFAEIARRFSQDRGSAGHAGEPAWVREDALLPAVREAVGGLAENAVSEPIRSPDSWHVVKLLATRPAGPASLAEARDGLVQALRQARAQQAARAYLDGLLSQEPIQINEIDLARRVAAPH
jgi:peptidylprolyl isomerase